VDCDVLQGDGGTRTACITGGYVALVMAVRKLMEQGLITENPIIHTVAAISAGIVDDVPMLDLQYYEDSRAMVDLNCVMTEDDKLIEIQGTGEGRAFSLEEQQTLVQLCAKGIAQLEEIQRAAIGGDA
jgi:ribonuclease PH